MKKSILLCLCILLLSLFGCSSKTEYVQQIINHGTILENPADGLTITERNIQRSGVLTNQLWSNFYNEAINGSIEYYPYEAEKLASAWHFTAIVSLMNRQLELNPNDENIKKRHAMVFEGLEYYREKRKDGHRVYAVERGFTPGNAATGINTNVYDDNMWIAREFLIAYQITGDQKYLTACQEVIDYCLTGWDHSINPLTGKEWGGIYWGPYYSSKHACSNGPIISTLVKLSEVLKEDTTKEDSYLNWAKKVYDFSYETFRRSDNIYGDMIGTEKDPITKQTISHGSLDETAYAYNTGTMISGGADLYRVTKDERYLTEAKEAAAASFNFFANGSVLEGYYQFPIATTLWFNLTLFQGYFDLYLADNTQTAYLDAIQKSIDFAYNNYLYNNSLPLNWISGWVYGLEKEIYKNVMDEASNAETFALLAQYNKEKEGK